MLYKNCCNKQPVGLFAPQTGEESSKLSDCAGQAAAAAEVLAVDAARRKFLQRDENTLKKHLLPVQAHAGDDTRHTLEMHLRSLSWSHSNVQTFQHNFDFLPASTVRLSNRA